MNTFSLIVLTVAVASAYAGAPAAVLSTSYLNHIPSQQIYSYGPPALQAVPVAPQVAVAQPVGRLIQRVSYTPPILSSPIAPPLAIPAQTIQVAQPQFIAQPQVVQQVARVVAQPQVLAQPVVQQIASPVQRFVAHPQIFAQPQVIAAPAPVAVPTVQHVQQYHEVSLPAIQHVQQVHQVALPAIQQVHQVGLPAIQQVQQVHQIALPAPQQIISQPVYQQIATPVARVVAQPRVIAAPAPVAVAHEVQQVYAQPQAVFQQVAHAPAAIATSGGYIRK